jgi:hypothetical protein
VNLDGRRESFAGDIIPAKAGTPAGRTSVRTPLNWLGDFDIGPTAVVYRKTGQRVPYSRPIREEFFAWCRYFFAVVGESSRLKPDFSIAFAPDPGRPWYLIWPVVKLAGGRITASREADVIMHFEDATCSPNAPPAAAKAGAKLINFGCEDVSKTRVAAAFEEAFGYGLALDPRDHCGEAVEKSERNGAHDGRIVICPTRPVPGKAYQRLVDNRTPLGDLVEDLRCPTIGGRPVCVFRKRRRVTERFANANVEVEAAHPEQVFTSDELARIAATTRRLGLDWGGLDVLRDRAEGRLYIVDANKTDMGPPTALPLPAKLDATRRLARAFRRFIGLSEEPSAR